MKKMDIRLGTILPTCRLSLPFSSPPSYRVLNSHNFETHPQQRLCRGVGDGGGDDDPSNHTSPSNTVLNCHNQLPHWKTITKE
jgi:hypothetical protein